MSKQYIEFEIVKEYIKNNSSSGPRAIKAKVKEYEDKAVTFDLDKEGKMETELRDKEEKIRELEDEIRELEDEIRDLKDEINELRKEEDEDGGIDMEIESRLLEMEEGERNKVKRYMEGIEARIINVEGKRYCNYDLILMRETFSKKFQGVLNCQERKARMDIRIFLDPKRAEKRRVITKRNYWKAKSGECEGGLC